MNEITKKIISIDNATISMKARYADLINKKEAELREKMQILEKKYANESIEEGERIYQEIVNQSEDQIKKSKDVTNFDNIDNTYNKLKSTLVDNLWNDLFSDQE